MGSNPEEVGPDHRFRYAVNTLDKVIDRIREQEEQPIAEVDPVIHESKSINPESSVRSRQNPYSRIASQLSDAESILREVKTVGIRVRDSLDQSVVTSFSPMERLIADVWKEVLQLHIVGNKESFFELGGHSLQATQIVSRLRKIFQTELTLTQFFDRPTIHELADFIQQQQIDQAEPGDIAELLEDLEGLSEEEVNRILSGQIVKDQN